MKIVEITGVGMLCAGYVMMVITWFMAFFGDPNTVLVTINSYNEMYLEYGILLLSLPVVIYTLKKTIIPGIAFGTKKYYSVRPPAKDNTSTASIKHEIPGKMYYAQIPQVSRLGGIKL